MGTHQQNQSIQLMELSRRHCLFERTVPPAIVEPEDRVNGTWCTCRQFARRDRSRDIRLLLAFKVKRQSSSDFDVQHQECIPGLSESIKF